MTRPRMAGSVESCMMLLVPLVKIITAAPVSMRAAANHQYPGASAARASRGRRRLLRRGERRGLAGWAGGEEGSGKRADGHDGGEQAEAAGVGVEDADGHGRDEDGEVEAEVPIRTSMMRIARRSGLLQT